MVFFGLEPWAAGWYAQTIPLSYGGTQNFDLYSFQSLEASVTFHAWIERQLAKEVPVVRDWRSRQQQRHIGHDRTAKARRLDQQRVRRVRHRGSTPGRGRPHRPMCHPGINIMKLFAITEGD